MNCILCISTGGLGDTVLFSPVIYAAKRRFRNSKIDLLVSSRLAEETYKGSEFIDHVHYVGLKERRYVSNTLSIASKVLTGKLRRGYDIGFFSTGLNPLLGYLLKALGVTKNTCHAPDSRLYGSDGEANLALAKEIFEHSDQLRFFVPLQKESKGETLKKLYLQGIDPNVHNVLAIYPSSEFWHRPRFDPSAMLGIAARLKAMYRNLKVVVVGSPAEGEEINRMDIYRTVDANMAGKLSISAVYCVFSMACLAMCNDGGLMHVAGASGCPLIAVMVNAPRTYSPPGSKTVVIRSDMNCCDGIYPRRPRSCKSPRCKEHLSQDRIEDIASSMLRNKGLRPF